MQNFVHLRLHTEFSITDGILRIKDAVNLAASDQMFALAVTDLHNMFGLVKFYKACRNVGVKPIIGVEINVIGNEDSEKYKILLLAKNIIGYKELCELITKSYTENKILDVPYVKEEWLLDKINHNLIALSGGVHGDIGQLICNGNNAQAVAFPDSYYIELQRSQQNNVNLLIKESVNLAHELDLPVVATHPIQFAKAEDFLAHEVRVCVAAGDQLDNSNRESLYSQDQFFISQAEMVEKFRDIPSAISNTLEIAKRCNVEIVLGKSFLPDFATPDNLPLEEYLSILANNGLDKRLQEIYSDKDELAKNEEVYRNNCPDGVLWLFSNCCRFHYLGKKQSYSGWSGTGIRCWIISGICVRDY